LCPILSFAGFSVPEDNDAQGVVSLLTYIAEQKGKDPAAYITKHKPVFEEEEWDTIQDLRYSMKLSQWPPPAIPFALAGAIQELLAPKPPEGAFTTTLWIDGLM
jgi:hypothetical protein